MVDHHLGSCPLRVGRGVPPSSSGNRLLFDEWQPHADLADEDTVAGAYFRIFDEAYDLLVEAGQGREEAISGARIILGSSE